MDRVEVENCRIAAFTTEMLYLHIVKAALFAGIRDGVLIEIAAKR
jgi:hypothetical protein